MPTRFALALTEEFLGTVSQLTGADADMFGDNKFVVLETTDIPTKFTLQFQTEDQMFELFKNDSSMHILNLS